MNRERSLADLVNEVFALAHRPGAPIILGVDLARPGGEGAFSEADKASIRRAQQRRERRANILRARGHL